MGGLEGNGGEITDSSVAEKCMNRKWKLKGVGGGGVIL